MKYSLVDTFSDEYGALDFTRSQNGSGVSRKSKVKNIAVFDSIDVIDTIDISGYNHLYQLHWQNRIEIISLI